MIDILVEVEQYEKERDELDKKIKEKKDSQEYRNAVELKATIDAVLKKHGIEKEGLLDLYGLSGAPKGKSKAKTTKAKAPLKTYKNPYTDEVVKARNLNKKELKKWSGEYGIEKVRTWEVTSAENPTSTNETAKAKPAPSEETATNTTVEKPQ